MSVLSGIWLEIIATMYGRGVCASGVFAHFVATMYSCSCYPLRTFDDAGHLKNAVLSVLSGIWLEIIATMYGQWVLAAAVFARNNCYNVRLSR